MLGVSFLVMVFPHSASDLITHCEVISLSALENLVSFHGILACFVNAYDPSPRI